MVAGSKDTCEKYAMFSAYQTCDNKKGDVASIRSATYKCHGNTQPIGSNAVAAKIPLVEIELKSHFSLYTEMLSNISALLLFFG